MKAVVVHGGGGEVSNWSSRVGLQSTFIAGLRVTNQEELQVVTAVLAGLVNKRLVLELNNAGGNAVGISGVDGGLIAADVMNPALGYVGDVGSVKTRLLSTLLDSGFLPVISPVCYGKREGTRTLLNVNADDVAAEIAIALRASRLVFLTDVPGVLDTHKKVLPRLSTSDVARLTKDGVIQGGMLPKTRACVVASQVVQETRIVDGTTQHALLREFDDQVGGTSIVRDELA